jgi:peptidoglycan hydrolase-like protein with peptidoglycan-binding domain
MRTAFILSALALSIAAAAAAPSETGPIAFAQRQLRSSGYDAGPVNGVMTEKTERAIRAYRRSGGGAALLAVNAAGNAVVDVQRALSEAGLLQAPADGVIGPATRDAIIRFEVAHRMPLDPRVSDRLLAALAPGAAVPAAAPAPPAAPTPPAPSGALGRQPLPPGVTPPPIR